MSTTAVEKLLGQRTTFTTAEALRAGLSARELYQLRDSGVIVELSRGVFRSANAAPTAHVSLLGACRRVPRGVICLITALHYWELTDELPGEVHLAIPRGTPVPKITYPPCAIHVFNSNTFKLGLREEHLIRGEAIRIYSPERTVVDVMRFRNKLGRDIAFKALQRFLATKHANPGEILRLARRLRVERAVADAIEVLAT